MLTDTEILESFGKKPKLSPNSIPTLVPPNSTWKFKVVFYKTCLEDMEVLVSLTNNVEEVQVDFADSSLDISIRDGRDGAVMKAFQTAYDGRSGGKIDFIEITSINGATTRFRIKKTFSHTLAYTYHEDKVLFHRLSLVFDQFRVVFPSESEDSE